MNTNSSANVLLVIFCFICFYFFHLFVFVLMDMYLERLLTCYRKHKVLQDSLAK